LRQLFTDILTVLTPREKRSLFALTLFDVVVSLLDIAFLAFLLFFIKYYTSGEKGPGFYRLTGLDAQSPFLVIGVFFGLFCIKNFVGYTVAKKQSDCVYGVCSRISADNMARYFASDYFGYTQVDSSVHIRRTSQEPIEFGHYVLRGVQQIVSQVMLILITIAAMLLYNASLFFLLLLVLLPPVIMVGYLMKRQLANIRKHLRTAGERTLQYLQEALSGFIDVLIYDRTSFFSRRYSERQQQLNIFLSGQQAIQSMPARLMEAFAIFGLFVLIVISRVSGNTVQLITIGAFAAAAYKIIPGVVKILNFAGQIKTYRFTLQHLLAEKTGNPVPAAVIPPVNELRLENVSFHYPGLTLLFNDISFSIGKGELVGLQGVSGKGKTTLVHLLLGFLQPVAGKIWVNNIPADAASLQQFRKHISYVQQQPFLIHDTVLQNIVLGEPGYDEQRFRKALQLTGLDEWLRLQPGGYHFVVEEKGRNISGGQRQRIVLARALYHEFDLLVLDEPFKELDEDSESSLTDHLVELARQGKMILLITHNSKTLTRCDKVLTINNE